MFDTPLFDALVRVGALGVLAGLIGSFIGSVRANLFGAALMGVIGAISAASVLRVIGVDPIVSAGQGFSYLWGGLGGLFLGYVVTRSSR